MNGCRPVRRLVAKGSVAQVEECECGVLHVTIGVLTIRLDRCVVGSVADTLAAALRELEEPTLPAFDATRVRALS